MSQDTRETFIWNGKGDDLDRLAELVTTKAAAELFCINKTLHHLQDGKLTQVDLRSMRSLISKYVKTVRLVNKGTADQPRFEVEFHEFEFRPDADPEFEPGQNDLASLITALVSMVSKPNRPIGVSIQDRRAIRIRRQSGESEERIAQYYRISTEMVRLVEETG
jgi:hypothetical protein